MSANLPKAEIALLEHVNRNLLRTVAALQNEVRELRAAQNPSLAWTLNWTTNMPNARYTDTYYEHGAPAPPPQVQVAVAPAAAPTSSIGRNASVQLPAALRVHPEFDGQTWEANVKNWETCNCSGLALTRVAVPTAIQPIWHGSTKGTLRRLLMPCKRSCTIGQNGCVTPEGVVIGKCNATHGVEYSHRLPHDGEPAIVSFNMPSAKHLDEVLKAISKARPRLYFEFEAAGHARVPIDAVLKGVDGMMSFQRDALVPYPYLSASQLWAAAMRQPQHGFHERRPAVAAFVSNCNSQYRNEVVDFLRNNASVEVHSFGTCYRPRGETNSSFDAREFRKTQGFESGVKPECLHYRAVLAVENSACTDYVTEKLIQAVGCGAIPIVRSINGMPNYESLYGKFPMLDATRLNTAFALAVRAALFDQRTYESYLPWHSPRLLPPEEVLAQKDVRNPHCALLDVISRSQEQSFPPLTSSMPGGGGSCAAGGSRMHTPRPQQRFSRLPAGSGGPETAVNTGQATEA